MRAALAVTMLLGVACAAARPSARIEPQAWSRNAPLSLTVVLADEHRGNPALEREFAAPFEKALRSNLQEAGFDVIGAAARGALHLSATTPANLTTNPISISLAVLSLDGVEIDRAEVDGRKLDCFAFWSWSYGNQQPNADCVARAVVAELLSSKRAPRAREIAARASGGGTSTAAPAPTFAQRPLLAGKLAVLELRNFTRDLAPQNVQYFTDLVRTASLRSLPGVQVITRENLLVLLQASGKSLENCEGECEVDTGRRIGADAIVSGEIQKLGSRYKLTLRLHDTREGRLLGSAQASGLTIDDLDNDAQRAARDLFEAH